MPMDYEDGKPQLSNEHYHEQGVIKEKEHYPEEYDIALLLIFTAERLLTRRKYFEATHNGMSTSFSDDPFILIKMQEFLNDPKVKERMEELRKEMS